MSKLRVGVLISGRGSNLAALIDAARAPDYPAEIVLVISNRPQAAGLDRARAAGIPVRALDHKLAESREAFDRTMDEALRAAGVEFVCMAGYLRVLSDGFVDAWHNRMINIHPALLPAYPGLDTHRRVLADGGRITGCTVHYVRKAVDTGPIIAQAAVPVVAGDDEASLAARVLAAEHVLYPFALRLVASGQVTVAGDEIRYAGMADRAGPALFSPMP
ncbi:phosphoribosylglycinamide formyltransferase [Rhodoligotrophos defluvii]|uniref:phosphoribosylglycinamide formyltransferase n=1 Tax=Rhodoligotrophos defluvii TaxID=2561934 RepID=UPI001485300A|nr:phosphoribosylglycinamide formyltransferase [Rhodoligotrophos defluvii]